MKVFLGQEAEFLIIGAVAGIGVLVRLLLFGYYVGVGKACRIPERTKNKTMAYIRKDLMEREENSREIKNAAVYTECRLAERRIAGIRLGVLECIWQQSLLMVALCGVLTTLVAMFRRAEPEKMLLFLLTSGTALFGLLVLDLLGGIKEKSKRIRLCIREHIENGGINCSDEVAVESKKTSRKEAKMEKREIRNEKRREKCEKKKERTAKKYSRKEEKRTVKAADRGNGKGKAQEEKRRLTEELLRERRQLEARSLAEQRRREREEENAEYRAEAEAAVTECTEPVVTESVEPDVTESAEPMVQAAEPLFQASSYEVLLNDVLAEYLA